MGLKKRYANDNYVDRLGASRSDISAHPYFVTPVGASGGSESTPLLLDTYTGAAAAYSLRKLRTAYTGSAIRVRRSSDSAEQDIGFTSAGDLDESALTTFVGAGDGFVTTWYDQQNSNDATQATALQQARIVSSGVVDKLNGFPCVRPRGAPGYSTGLTIANDISVVCVVDNSEGLFSSNNRRLVTSYTSGAILPSFFLDWSSNRWRFYAGDGTIDLSDATQSMKLVFAARDGTNNYLGINGGAASSATSSAEATGVLHLMEDVSGTAKEVVAAAYEFVIYSADKTSDRAGIESNVNDYWSVY